VAILAPWRPSSAAPGLRLGRRWPQRRGGVCHLLGHDGVRRAALATQQGYTQQTQARPRRPIQGRKKPLSARGHLARCGHHPMLATHQDASIGLQPMRAPEKPVELPPRQAGMEKTVDRPSTAACAGPAGQAAHRPPTAHGQHRLKHPPQGAQRGSATHWLQQARRTIMAGMGGGSSWRLGLGHP
jgi:hypothetical protein